ncbi:MAG: biotin/lipoyl-binding protein, partial [Stellaceae bacterium]
MPQPNNAAATGRRLQIAAAAVAVLLLVGFVVANRTRSAAEAELADAAHADADAPVPVIVVRAGTAPASQTLTLPGETAAWYESTIYGRVNGYVGKWVADIGDHVKKGEVLATIETPDLDADFTAAQAKLKAADAE